MVTKIRNVLVECCLNSGTTDKIKNVFQLFSAVTILHC